MQLLSRNPDSHKGDFGHVFILSGSGRFSGAAVLCAEAAMRSGAGLVTLGVPKSINSAIIRIKPKEVMTLPLDSTREDTLKSSSFAKIFEFLKKIDVLLLGPGLSENNSTQKLIRRIISSVRKPMVVDADGINALNGNLKILKNRLGKAYPLILTPHPGEMGRLLGLSTFKIQNKRKEIAMKVAKDFDLTVVLKGHNTIVASSKGKIYINHTGNPGMASAGSGDVLSGIIAAFLGQGLSAFNSAKHAVYLHGVAGDLASNEKTQLSLIASDIIAKIPEAIKLSSKS